MTYANDLLTPQENGVPCTVLYACLTRPADPYAKETDTAVEEFHMCDIRSDLTFIDIAHTFALCSRSWLAVNVLPVTNPPLTEWLPSIPTSFPITRSDGQWNIRLKSIVIKKHLDDKKSETIKEFDFGDDFYVVPDTGAEHWIIFLITSIS